MAKIPFSNADPLDELLDSYDIGKLQEIDHSFNDDYDDTIIKSETKILKTQHTNVKMTITYRKNGQIPDFELCDIGERKKLPGQLINEDEMKEIKKLIQEHRAIVESKRAAGEQEQNSKMSKLIFDGQKQSILKQNENKINNIGSKIG